MATRCRALPWQSNGQLTPLAQLGAAEGWGIHTPTALATVRVAGQDFALVGSAGSQSLSVLFVDPNGQLTVRDHIVDTQEGRFGGITALDVCQQDGWTLISAAGRDGGVSVFALLPSGQLIGLVNAASLTAPHLGGPSPGFPGLTAGSATMNCMSLPHQKAAWAANTGSYS